MTLREKLRERLLLTGSLDEPKKPRKKDINMGKEKEGMKAGVNAVLGVKKMNATIEMVRGGLGENPVNDVQVDLDDLSPAALEDTQKNELANSIRVMNIKDED